MASRYHDEAIIGEALDIFSILIESEEVEFLKERGFADALLGFIGNISTTGPMMVPLDIEGRIVEVLFGIASRIRLQPHLLPSWFRLQKSHTEDIIEHARDVHHTRNEKEGFPLFYLTLDYVHHDGRVGDFARTGLLYIIETTTHSETLEKWIVESDLATLMASGLGALYSQLSRKLVLSLPKEVGPATFSNSEERPASIPQDVEETTSPEFQAHLSTFLSYLAFWQDMLEHCNSSDVKRILLDHFKFLFLQQLLYVFMIHHCNDSLTLHRYPSLIESSDTDGGSSVAVLTYLRCIIESIDNADLLAVTLQYLLALPEIPEIESKPMRPTTLARRRKSSMLVSNLAKGQEKPMPDLFTLVDLVLTSLRSRDQQTITATLGLVLVILRAHHQYAVSSIVKTQTDNHQILTRTLGAHNRHTGILFTMAEDLIEHDNLGEAYGAHLQDARTLLELHCCSCQLLALPSLQAKETNPSTQEDKSNVQVRPHCIRDDDPLLSSLVSLLEDFLVNDFGTNLSLSQTLSTLASCGNTSLNRWLLSEPVELDTESEERLEPKDMPKQTPSQPSDDHTEDDGTVTGRENIDYPGGTLTGVPSVKSPVFAALDDLVNQVERFRQEIQDFDTYLAEQRHVFTVGEGMQDALRNDRASVRQPGEVRKITTPQARGLSQISSISERMMYENQSSDDSVPSSPRGRQPNTASSSALAGRLNHLRISPSPSPSKSPSRTFSPPSLRTDKLTTTPLKGAVSSVGSPDVLRQKVRIKAKTPPHKPDSKNIETSETGSFRSESTTDIKPLDMTVEVTLGHLITNIIILQEFILELVAIIEVRASLFGEVIFT